MPRKPLMCSRATKVVPGSIPIGARLGYSERARKISARATDTSERPTGYRVSQSNGPTGPKHINVRTLPDWTGLLPLGWDIPMLARGTLVRPYLYH